MENITINRLDNIHVFSFGLGDESAELPFYSGPDSNLGASSFYSDHRSENRLLGKLSIRVGDEVVAELGNPRVDIVKADVEGFEKHVLAGLKTTLVRSRPILIVELSAKTRETIPSQAALEALLPPDYRYYYFAIGKRDSGRYSLAPFSYERLSKIEDVIAVPVEKESWLPRG